MSAVTFSQFGSPDVLTVSGLPVPEPAKGEVVVRVAASTVNPTDLLMRSGRQVALMADLAPPFIAGMEFSGVLHRVGEGVELLPGQAVIGVVNPRRPDGGAHAEYIRLSAASVAPVADGIDLIAAATVPMNALTAWLALEMVDLCPGQTLLVTGGAGMLGGSVIQLARHLGLRVVVNGSERDAPLLRQLGATLIVPRDEGMEDAIRSAYPAGVDAMIDGALIGSRCSGLVRDGGSAVSLRMSHPIEDPRLRTLYVSVLNGMERTDLLEAIARLLEQKALMPRIAEGGLFSFRDAIQAHGMAEKGGFRGRVVMVFDPQEPVGTGRRDDASQVRHI
jgi:NADPH:quinone reductase-like Zn-dependent oxidoreductase